MSRFLAVLLTSLVFCSGQEAQLQGSSGSGSGSPSPMDCGVAWYAGSPPCGVKAMPSTFSLSDISDKSTGGWAFASPQPAHTLAIKFSSLSSNPNPTLTMDLSGFWNATNASPSLSTSLCDVNGIHCTPYDTAAINPTTHVYSANLNTLLPGDGYKPFGFAFIQLQDTPGKNNTNWDTSGPNPVDSVQNPAWNALFDPKNTYNGVVLAMSIQ